MQPNSLTLKDRLATLKPKHWVLIGAGALLLLILSGSGGSSVDPASWDCDNIQDDVIAMSQERDLEVLEISDAREIMNIRNHQIICKASAEWNQGYGPIEYGAQVTGSGNLIISYMQI